MSNDYWKDNGIEKPKSFVVCAACKFEDVIILGDRHWDGLMQQQYSYMLSCKKWQSRTCPPKAHEFEEGFINQFGEFLDRKEAMIAAKLRGQPVDIEHGCGGDCEILYSEGLY